MAAGSADTMTIGAFARATRLSVKALRYYESHGLLTPHDVDDRSGYRYYHPDQVERADLIARLRDVSMPLSTIADVLGARDRAEADRLLAFWWAGQERSLRVRRDLVRSVRGVVGGDPAVSAASLAGRRIRIRRVQTRTYLTIRQHVAVERLPALIGDTVLALGRWALSGAGTATHPITVVYVGRVSHDSNGPVEVRMPTDPGQWPGAVDHPAGVTLQTEPAHDEMWLPVTKQQLVFPDVLAVYDRLESEMVAAGDCAAGPPREHYIHDLATAAPGTVVCHAAVPLRASDS